MKLVRCLIACCACLTAASTLLAQSDSLPRPSSSVPADTSTSATTTGQATAGGGSTLTVVQPASKGSAAARETLSQRTLLQRTGAAVQIGVNGIGGDVAFELAQHFNVRVGGSYFQIKPSFTSDGAQIATNFRLGYGKVSVDYFPFHNGFFVSPLLTVGNLIGFRGTVIVPAGQDISLAGGDYRSSATDPLRGAASIDTRKVSPGLSIGYGNIVPRSESHFSFPVELGFYYVATPRLKVTFDGSACDPTQPPAIGCKKALSDPGFQSDLTKFIARNNKNLSYAKFLPIATFGVGYRF